MLNVLLDTLRHFVAPRSPNGDEEQEEQYEKSVRNWRVFIGWSVLGQWLMWLWALGLFALMLPVIGGGFAREETAQQFRALIDRNSKELSCNRIDRSIVAKNREIANVERLIEREDDGRAIRELRHQMTMLHRDLNKLMTMYENQCLVDLSAEQVQ